MYSKVAAIIPNSPISDTVAAAGDILRRINGHEINDILDYEYYSYDSRLLVELSSGAGKIKLIRLAKPEGTPLGIVFETPLIDKERSCRNKCIFCFIDQLPKGMRDTLYYKDDDVRLSFLEGNYVTLTNLSRDDINRIIKMRISPINVSVHTLDLQLRSFMLGRNFNNCDGNPIEYLKMLSDAGITLNCQIVCCPGVNDKDELKKTIKGLMQLGESVNSVSIVPVGLTKHREGLHKLQAFDKELAEAAIALVERYAKKCRKQRGDPVFYCSDELYMMAGTKLPPHKYYRDYPQLENGVGMMRLFITEFMQELDSFCETNSDSDISDDTPAVSVVTGTLAAPYLTKLLRNAAAKCDKISGVMPNTVRLLESCKVYPVVNEFFGDTVTVSGLVTGGDIIKQLQGKSLGDILFIPSNMLRHDDVVFLDDVTVGELSQALNTKVQIVRCSGSDFFKALTAQEQVKAAQEQM